MSLNAKMVIGYVAFCSLEVNGTFLSCGIIDKCLATEESRKIFERSVEKGGMYSTLVHKAIEIARIKGIQVYTASEKNRHLGNNRGCNGIPIIGQSCFQMPEDVEKGSQEETEFLMTVFRTLDAECSSIEDELLKHCNSFREIVADWEELGGTKDRVEFSHLARAFLKEIEEIGGKGTGPNSALNFLQVASMFGFLPQRVMTWSTVGHSASGGYKYIKDMYKDDPAMNTTKADLYFNESIGILRDLYGDVISAYFIENLLCELWRKRDGKVTPKRDCFFGYEYRKSSANPWGAQNLYRIVRTSATKVTLEMCSPKRLVNNKTKKKLVVMEITNQGYATNSLINWDDNGSNTGVKQTAHFRVPNKMLDLLDEVDPDKIIDQL